MDKKKIQDKLYKYLHKLGFYPLLDEEVGWGKAGTIDIMTEREIIVIQKHIDWKNAIGEIISCGFYYPNLKRRIHLYDVPIYHDLPLIRRICDVNRIALSYENGK